MSAQAEAAPVVWHIPDEAHEVQRVTLRGARYVILEEDYIPKDIDPQVGDVLVLWSGPAVGDGRGIAVKLLHDEQLLNRKNAAVWRVFQISEPMDARLISDEGTEDAEPEPADATDRYDATAEETIDLIRKAQTAGIVYPGGAKDWTGDLRVEDNDGD